ncbi:MAG TPA: hypothetical protein VFC99_05460 [Acidimicrobiia bacterium]|nr:hypothetical protein [Acidimicrobiia bacterium]
MAKRRGLRTGSVALVIAVAIGVSANAAGAAHDRNRGARRVAHAASAFANEGTARIDGTVEVEVTSGPNAGKRVSLPFTGEIDNRAKVGSFSFDASGLGSPGISGRITEVFAGNALYMSLDAFGRDLGDTLGKHWMKIDLGQFGAGASQTQQSDPTSVLDGLRGVSNRVDDLGHETVRGVDTTHYRATVDVEAALARVPEKARARARSALSQFGRSEFPMDVWLDRHGVPRRYALTMDVTKGGSAGHISESFDFYDFGAPVSVKVPSADDVLDYTDVVKQKQTGQVS